MNGKKIDLENWGRRELYQEFIQMTAPAYDMSVRMDVTKLVNYCKENSASFFVNYLYICLRELNRIEEFRMRAIHWEPWIFDRIDCSFTVMNQYGYFVNRSMEFSSYKTFYKNAVDIMQKAKTEKKIHPEQSDLARADIIYFSAIPWVDYQSMTLPVVTHSHDNSDPMGDSIPRIGWGKFVAENNLYKMTMHMTVNHAFIDGKPLADAFNNIQAALDALDFEK